MLDRKQESLPMTTLTPAHLPDAPEKAVAELLDELRAEKAKAEKDKPVSTSPAVRRAVAPRKARLGRLYRHCW